jgi:creatinine amidohydrolase
MTPDEFESAVAKLPVFLVPTGLLEWHADHLPLGLDSLKAHAICLKIAERLGGGIVLPPNYYGRPGYSRYPGTLTFSDALMTLLFTELCDQLRKVGAKVIVLLTGHYGPCQMDFLKRFADVYQHEHDDVKLIAQAEYEGVTIDGHIPWDHAGKWETSMMMHLHPELVKLERFRQPTRISRLYLNPPHDEYKETTEWTWWSQDVPRDSSAELGRRCVDAIVEYLDREIRRALAV